MQDRTSRLPMPNPRAAGTSSTMRNLATVSSCFTTKAQPSRSSALAFATHREIADFMSRIELVDEIGGDARDERLETDIPAVLARIKLTMLADHPADVTGTVRTQADPAVGVYRVRVADNSDVQRAMKSAST